MLLNGQAAALLAQGKAAEAEPLLLAAQEKAGTDAETLVNLITASLLLGRPPEAHQRALSTLKDAHPAHPFLALLAEKEADFEREAAKFAPSKAAA